MPLWRIFSNPSTFSPATKSLLSKAITALYTDPAGAALPAFYVNVLFIPLADSDFYIGGESRSNFVRIVVEQIALRMPNDINFKRHWLDSINDALKPFIADQCLDWELHIVETERDLWRVQGIDPPLPGTEAHKIWATGNRPVPLDKILKAEL